MATFEVPRRVWVRGRWWRVRRRKRLPVSRPVSHPTESFDAEGVTCKADHVIDVRAGIEGEEARVALVHELIHACSRERVDDEVEERLVADVDVALTRALERLPWE